MNKQEAVEKLAIKFCIEVGFTWNGWDLETQNCYKDLAESYIQYAESVGYILPEAVKPATELLLTEHEINLIYIDHKNKKDIDNSFDYESELLTTQLLKVQSNPKLYLDSLDPEKRDAVLAGMGWVKLDDTAIEKGMKARLNGKVKSWSEAKA